MDRVIQFFGTEEAHIFVILLGCLIYLGGINLSYRRYRKRTATPPSLTPNLFKVFAYYNANEWLIFIGSIVLSVAIFALAFI